MPRLIDDLRAEKIRLAVPEFVMPDKVEFWRYVADNVIKSMMQPDLPVLLIDNVADYYFSSEQEYWDLRLHFPNLAPPYPVFWCECKVARRIHSAECGDTDVAALVPRGRMGMLIHGLERAQIKGEFPEGMRWLLWCELFIDYGIRGITASGPHGSMFLCVDAQGAIIEHPWIQSFAKTEDQPMVQALMTWLHPAFLAMSFLHCKNVTVVDNTVPAPLARKYKTKTGVEPCRYKTLVIEPLKQILRTQGRSGEVGLQKALHICRGHFADYREGRGLFGKYHQIVWIPSIVRGTKGKSAPAREIELKL